MEKLLPHRILVIGWVIWLCMFILSPNTYYALDPILPAVTLLVCYNLALYWGLYISPNKARILNTAKQKTKIDLSKINKLFWLTFILGLVGNVLNIYVKITTIGTFNIVNGEENRIAILESGELAGNPFAVAAAVCYPFSIVTFLLSVYFRKFFSKTQYLLGLILGASSSLFLLLLGSRSSFFFFLELSFFAVFLQRSLFERGVKKLITRAQKLKLIGAGGLVVLVFSAIQAQRSTVIGLETKTIFDLRADSQQWKYNPNSLTGWFIGDKPYLFSGVLDFVHYYIHGVFEFIRQYNFSQTQYGSLYGKYEFYVFFKLFKFLGFDSSDTFSALTTKYFLKPGTYSTFWGPFFVDFGIFGVLIIFLVGKLVRNLFLNFRDGKIGGLLFVPIILAMIFSIPITNTAIGQNTYVLVSVFLSILMYKYIL